MSAFKDAVEKDIKATFLNLDEFADMHSVNGELMQCLVDTDIIDPYGDTRSHPIEGVFLNTVTLYVHCVDIPKKPVEGELLYLDDKMYIVRHVSVEMGVYVIILEANEQ